MQLFVIVLRRNDIWTDQTIAEMVYLWYPRIYCLTYTCCQFLSCNTIQSYVWVLSYVLKNQQEDADEVDDSKVSRDNKCLSYVLRRLWCGKIHFYRRGRLFCPFCDRAINVDLDSMIQHAAGVGRGGGRRHRPITLARHATFYKFLQDYVRTGMYPLTRLSLPLVAAPALLGDSVSQPPTTAPAFILF